MSTPQVAGIVLAAGASKRLGRPKQLLEFECGTIIRKVVETALASTLSHVVVVIGADAKRVAGALDGLPIQIVENSNHPDGQSSSLKAGLSEALETDAILFLLGDQPEIKTETIDSILDHFRQSGASIVQPLYGETPSNPVLFARAHFAELMELTGDTGAKPLIRKHMDVVERVRVSAAPPPADIDTEADYQALLERQKAMLQPSQPDPD